MNLDPNRKYDSPYFIETGNPALRPSTKRQLDIEHTYERGQTTVTQTIFFRNTSDDISQYVISDGKGVTTVSYTNLGSSKTYGYSVTLKGKPVRTIEIGIGFDYYHKNIVAPASLSNLGSVKYNGINANGTVDIAIGKRGSISGQTSYQGRTLDLGIETPAYFTSELDFRRKITKTLTLSAIFADVGITLRRTAHFYGSNLNGTEVTWQRSRLARLSLSSSF